MYRGRRTLQGLPLLRAPIAALITVTPPSQWTCTGPKLASEPFGTVIGSFLNQYRTSSVKKFCIDPLQNWSEFWSGMDQSVKKSRSAEIKFRMNLMHKLGKFCIKLIRILINFIHNLPTICKFCIKLMRKGKLLHQGRLFLLMALVKGASK